MKIHLLAAAFALVLLQPGGCTITLNPDVTPNVVPTHVPFGGLPTYDAGGPSVTPPPGGVPNTAVPTPSGWNPVAHGIQWWQTSVRNSRQQSIDVLVVKVNPANVRFRVLYQPGQARSIQDWHAALPDALLIVNANYYDSSNRALGLVISDSLTYGAPSPRNDDGMFQVTNGAARLRSLYVEPIGGGEQFEQAAQAYPLLMLQGQIAPINPDLSGTPARRTVLAQDSDGNILFVLFPNAGVTLSELGGMLQQLGLGITAAINMDGGQSTCLFLAIPNTPNPYLPGFAPVPVVLAAYAR
ncbi:MAG TPA: phosphodiester glycosidase family protein [Aggregatilineales bacterium]|nr:phosphodiester glycosidase family protein [Aggregatilineales bacterium]